MKNILMLKRCIIFLLFICTIQSYAQINTTQVMNIGKNALYFEDYILSIQYFNQVIKAKPYMAEPYFLRAVAKLYLEDYQGAEEDSSLAIERNPFITDAYQVRGIARQALKKNKEAIEDYNHGLEQSPEHKVFLINKAVAELEIKEYDEADSTFTKLIKLYPNFENAYLGRAELRLAKKDTVEAIKDIDKSIQLSKNNSNAYVMRADLKTRFSKDFKGALADMDEAIKLEPHYAGYFINRAYLKYHSDDYFGAMADYDYALSLDPSNLTAHLNRGLLLTEVRENNKAIEDFSFVIRSEPKNAMAHYNRAELYVRTGQYRKAINDYDVVLKHYPDFEVGYYARSECKRHIGDMSGGEKDYNISRQLYKKRKKFAEYTPEAEKKMQADMQAAMESPEATKNKFKSLLTIENDNTVKPQYENKARGKIQDYNVKIDPEPIYMLSYYNRVNTIKESSNITNEITELNDAHILPYTIRLTDGEVQLYEDQISKHFSSIEYYTSAISDGKERSIDYFARAMDYIMVKNYQAAITDLNKAIELSGNKFVLAYFARANALLLNMKTDEFADENQSDNKGLTEANVLLNEKKRQYQLQKAISDFETVIRLSPKMVYAYYNMGNIYLQMQDFTSALSAYGKAIDLKSDFGEAYYNRGLVYLELGNKEKGVTDLSKAGELGITPSYNVLKRMNK